MLLLLKIKIFIENSQNTLIRLYSIQLSMKKIYVRIGKTEEKSNSEEKALFDKETVRRIE